MGTQNLNKRAEVLTYELQAEFVTATKAAVAEALAGVAKHYGHTLTAAETAAIESKALIKGQSVITKFIKKSKSKK